MNAKDSLRARFTVYMSKVLYHSRIDYIRKKQRTEAFEILTQDALRMAQQKEALPAEESQQLLAATQVAGLSPAELDVLRKFFYEERDMREIAQEMRISLRGAYVIKDRALKKLRKALLREGRLRKEELDRESKIL